MSLEKDIKQATFSSVYQKMVLNIVYTAEWLNRETNQIFKQYSITNSQFNILRILAGSNPTPLSPGAIKEVMIFKSSDLTRLLDRLEKKELVSRILCASNRRKIDVGITEKGLALLGQINPKIQEKTADFYQNKLTVEEAEQMNVWLEKIRS